jgi:hypothetical protein
MSKPRVARLCERTLGKPSPYRACNATLKGLYNPFRVESQFVVAHAYPGCARKASRPWALTFNPFRVGVCGPALLKMAESNYSVAAVPRWVSSVLIRG